MPDTLCNIEVPKSWPFEEAAKVAARLAATGKTSALFETGYGPSGLPHIGTFGEVARTTWVRRAFTELTGLPSRLLAFSDDMDGLRKVPDNVPNRAMLAEFIGMPLTKVPDPFGTHDSFGAHNNARLRTFLDGFGFAYEFASSTEYYTAGRFDAALMTVAARHAEIVATILPTLGPDRRSTYSPFLPIHPKSGRVMQVRIDRVDAEAGMIAWQDPETGEHFETPVRGGGCKLQWKADWAMRWHALDVDYEMSGKDLIDSVRLSGRVCQVLGSKPPVGFTYELFLDEQHQKISKSKGNGLSVEQWLTYAPPESLAQFMFNQPQRAKRLFFDVIPRAVDEFIANAAKLPEQEPAGRSTNPAWHVLGGSNQGASSPVSFGMLLNLASVVNADTPDMLWGFLKRYSPDAAPGHSPFFDALVGHAVRYYQDFVRPAKQFRPPTEVERAALLDLAAMLRALPPGESPEAIQDVVYAVGKRHPFAALKDWFACLYQVLLGQQEGPRFGGFVALYGVQETIRLIETRLAGPTGNPLMVPKLKRAARHLPAVLGLALLVGAVYVVWKEFRHLKLDDIKASLTAIPHTALLVSFLWTILSYGLLTFYDRLGTIYAGHKVSTLRVAFASFCAYSLSHNLGFAAVSGAAVRYRLYAHWGLTPFQIAKVVAFCSLTFTLGGLVLGGTILFLEPDAIPFIGDLLPRVGMYAIGLAMFAVVIAYITLSRFVGVIKMFGVEIGLPGWRMALAQVTLATVDVAFTAGIFYQLLPKAPGLTYLRFLGVYVASYTAGLAANVPGGIGVFDAAMLKGLENYLQPAPILGAVIVFRLYYYIIPLFLAGALFAGNEILLRGGALLHNKTLEQRAQGPSRWSGPAFATIAATSTVALCGALLLGIGLLDQRPDFSWIDPDYADLAATAGQYVPSLIGAALIVLSIGLSQRVTLAWGSTLVLLLLAAGFTAVQGDAYGNTYWVPAVLVIAALLLVPFRDAYYRQARLLSGPLQAGTAFSLFGLVLCVGTLAAFEPQVRGMSENSIFDVLLSADMPNGLRATVGATLALALIALWRLIRPGRVQALPWAGEGRLRYASFGALPPVSADGIVLGELGRAGVPYLRVGDVLLGLGDPAGAVSDRVSAIWNLRDLAQQDGLDAAFWRAGPGLLKVYADLGLAAFPLGADGLPLPESTEMPQRVSAYLCCMAERDMARLLPMLPNLVVSEDMPDAAD